MSSKGNPGQNIQERKLVLVSVEVSGSKGKGLLRSSGIQGITTSPGPMVGPTLPNGIPLYRKCTACTCPGVTVRQ